MYSLVTDCLIKMDLLFITCQVLDSDYDSYKGILFSFQAEDLIDDLLSLESGSLASDSYKTSDNSLTGSIKNEPFLYSDAELHALAKDRQKKDNHNMSE